MGAGGDAGSWLRVLPHICVDSLGECASELSLARQNQPNVLSPLRRNVRAIELKSGKMSGGKIIAPLLHVLGGANSAASLFGNFFGRHIAKTVFEPVA